MRRRLGECAPPPLRRLVDRFAALAEQCVGLEHLSRLLEDVTRELGFHYFALLHHASLRFAGTPLLRADNYPPDWVEEFAKHQMWHIDPIQLASLKVNTGFAWDRVGRIVELNNEGRQVLEQSRRFGLGEGFTVPTNIPGEPAASCSFVTRFGVELPAERLRCAELVGSHAFEALRRIGGFARCRSPHLSPRELECARLVALGKSDWEIAQILGISPQTAHQYVKRSRAAYNVATRTQLALLGIRDGWLQLEDLGAW